MAGGIQSSLKRWRDNYFLSMLLTTLAKPVHHISSKTAHHLEQKIRRNGVSLKLPNGKYLKLARGTSIGLSSAFYWHGLTGFEPETCATLRFFFECGQSFVDVGANAGFYSLLGGLWNPKLRVTAFEPVPQIFAGLVRNVRLNGLEDRIRCENVALSSRSGSATLLLPPSEGLDAETTGTLVLDGWQARKNSPRLQVSTLRFDDYEKRSPMRVDTVKIDVEDFEADVLDGMRRTIIRDQPFIVCEILPRPHKNARTLDVIQSLGYQAYWITSQGYIRVPDFAFQRVRGTDFLLSPVSTPEVVLTDLRVLWSEAGRDHGGVESAMVHRDIE
jgi:FkbM family methyltransferase